VTATRLMQMGMLPRTCRAQRGFSWTPEPRCRAFGTQPCARQCGSVTPPSWMQLCPMLSAALPGLRGEDTFVVQTTLRTSRIRYGCATKDQPGACCASSVCNHAHTDSSYRMHRRSLRPDVAKLSCGPAGWLAVPDVIRTLILFLR
jgi:hypothetical protein